MTRGYFKAIALFSTCTMLLTGCSVAHTASTNTTGNTTSASSAAYEIARSTYDGQTGTVTVHVTPSHKDGAQRDRIDVSNNDGIVNYATAEFPTKSVEHVALVFDPSSPTAPASDASPSALNRSVTVPTHLSSSATTPSTSTLASGAIVAPLPPGVQMDSSITPLAVRNSSAAAKKRAVLSVAMSKIGTPYIWGHDEDRGQYGFDCSNFTAYVYHHALGYIITPLSVDQYKSVGIPVSRSQMKAGDLIIFERGKHVGIYAGKNRVIQCGGGLQKVGYISIANGTYWGNHISVVKRMF